MATGWRLAKSLEKLRDQINSSAPNRSKASDGTIGDAAHAAIASDHNPNKNNVVCAIDITNDPANGLDIHAIAEHLRVNRHPNLRYIISNARIAGWWTNWEWQASSGHTKHAHFSVGTLGVGDGQTYDRYDNTNAWDINLEGEEMSKPTPVEVLEHFRKFQSKDPNQAQIDYYIQKDWGILNGDLLEWNLAKRKEVESELAKKPKEVIVEKPVEVVKEVIKEIPVEKIVEKEIIKEVIKGDEDRTFGDLFYSAFRKLFNLK